MEGRRLTGRRRWLVLAVLLLLAGLAGWRLPDFGLSYGLVRSLHSLGWPNVSVLDGSLSLFKGAIRVQQMQAGPDLGKALGLDRLDLEFRWKPIFSRRISLAHLELHGLQVDVTQHPDGRLEVNGLPLLLAAGGESSGWSYDVTSLSLTGGQISWNRQGHSLNVQIDRLDIADLRSWQPDHPTQMHLQGWVNGQPITLDITATPFASTPSFTLHGVAEALDLAGLPMIFPVPVQGTGRIDINLSGNMERIQGDGQLSLDKPRLTATNFTAQAEHLRLDIQNLDWAPGSGQLSSALDISGQEMDTTLNGVSLRQKSARLQAKSLSWHGARQTIDWDGQFEAGPTELSADPSKIRHDSLLWQGKVHLDLAPRATSFSRGDGTVQIQSFSYQHQGIRAEAGHIRASGTFEHGLPHGLLPPLLGDINVSGEQISLSQPDMEWLRLASVKAPQVRLSKTHIAVPQAEAKGVAALSRSGKNGFPWRVESRSLALERLMMDRDGGITAGNIQVERALLRVTRGKRGFVGLPDGMGTASAPPSPRSDTTTNASDMPPVVVGQVRFSNSRLEFDDKTLSVPVQIRLDGVDLAVQSLDSQNVDHNSPFTAQGRIGNAVLNANGTMRPFQTRPGGELRLTVRDLDLPVLSPYAQEMLGLFVNTGHVNGTVTLSAQAGTLNGSMEMNLDRLVMVQPGPETRLPKPPALPIETVLDLLRQGDGKIHLTIPISGDLSQPNFDFSDAVGQAIGSAVKSTLFTTLKVAFPLLALIDLAIEENGKQHLALEPIAFPPGSADLDSPQQAKLAHVADFLHQSPSITLTVCGFATAAQDGPALAQQQGLLGRLQRLVGMKAEEESDKARPVADQDMLTNLAAARAEAGRAYLVDKAKIPANRLFTCRPQIDYDAGRLPRIDMLL